MQCFLNDGGTTLRYICIDIGGTTIKYALADENGILREKKRIASRAKEQGGIVEQIVATVNECREKNELDGAAIATAGLVDENGTVVFAGENFVDYSGTKLRDIVEKECGLPCSVTNDANAAALGEYWRGVGKEAESMFMITVGTGIGGAFVKDGQVLFGAGCSAGEIGFLPMGDGVKLEDLASGGALMKKIAAANFSTKQGDEPAHDPANIFAMARANDTTTKRALQDMCRYLARGIASVCCVVNPAVVVLGGGAMSDEEYLRPLLEEELAKLLPVPLTQATRLKFAELKNDAGMIGALKYFLSHKNAER